MNSCPHCTLDSGGAHEWKCPNNPRHLGLSGGLVPTPPTRDQSLARIADALERIVTVLEDSWSLK